jgi:hypothetical protein
MRKMRFWVVAAVGLAVALGLPGAVRSADGDRIITAISYDDLKALCTAEGYQPEDSKDTDGDPSLVLKMADYKVAVLLYDKDPHPTIGLQSNFKMDEPPGFDIMNKWNVDKRYTRAYRNDQRLSLEADLDLAGGVTPATVARWLARFAKQLPDFAKHIGYVK